MAVFSSQRYSGRRFLLIALELCYLAWVVRSAFIPNHYSKYDIRKQCFQSTKMAATTTAFRRMRSLSLSMTTSSKYIPPPPEEPATTVKKKSLHPKIGDVVRYFDLDGGRADGQVLVGKISFIQTLLTNEANDEETSSRWLVELNELEDVGDGYYAEYSSRQRNFKKATRNLDDVSPISASFVRSESAFKVPRDIETLRPLVKAERYDLDDYPGPVPVDADLNQEVIQQDAERYEEIKGSLLRNAAIAGLAGALVVNLLKGPEDALIFAAGALASVGYLFFLALKTDTLASPGAKMGRNISNLRFFMPVLVIVGVAFYNKSLGDSNPRLQSDNPFNMITTEQFASAIIGFLTYRIPLFLSQIQEAFKEDDEEGGLAVPGSIGVAMKMAQGTEDGAPAALEVQEDLTTVLLVSGPQATGRSALVQKFLAESNDRFVAPKRVDRYADGATFERLQQRDEFLYVDSTERYGITRQGVLMAASDEGSVVIVDADVELAKRMAKVSGAKLIGVWVGLDSVDKFESRLEEQIEAGEIDVPEDESKESVIRAKIREIVKEIEYGITSGMFEFTILNDDEEDSLRQLRDAAAYCFK